MRRMRDKLKYLLWFGVPALAVGSLVYFTGTDMKSVRGVASFLGGNKEAQKKTIPSVKTADLDADRESTSPQIRLEETRSLKPFDPLTQLEKGGICSRIELRGESPSTIKLDQKKWA